MEQRTLELELVCANDVKNVNFFSNYMNVYAVVTLIGDTFHGKQKTKTEVLLKCDTYPKFNCKSAMRFTLDDTLLMKPNRLSLDIRLVSKRFLLDRVIGIVRLDHKVLFDSLDVDRRYMKLANFPVRRPSGRVQGDVSLSYKFGEKETVKKPARKKPHRTWIVYAGGGGGCGGGAGCGGGGGDCGGGGGGS